MNQRSRPAVYSGDELEHSTLRNVFRRFLRLIDDTIFFQMTEGNPVTSK